jgi:glycerol-3-phosphate O-acyltransferase
VEFFVEGGRTRSGGLMPPKLGVLGMVLDAAEVRAHGREVTVLPIALAYEQVAEEGAYARELGGEQKRPETLGQIIRARSVLRRRFGRVYLRVGEPLPCAPLVDARDGRPTWSERPADERKATTSALGHQIVAEIGRVMVLLPTSLVAIALLAVPKRAVFATELQERIHRFDGLFARLGVLRAASFDRFDQAIAQALDRFVRDGRIAAMEHKGERLWSIEPEQRLLLDFYKNQVLHFLAPMGLVACAIRGEPEGTVTAEALAPSVAALVRLLRRELVFGPEPDESSPSGLRQCPPERVLEQGLQGLVEHGALRPVDHGFEIASVVRIGEVFGLFRPLLEGYVALLRAPIWPAAPDGVVAAVQAAQPSLLADGTVTCPESLSGATLQNAVATCSEDGVLLREGDRLRPGPDAEALLARLRPMVGTR